MPPTDSDELEAFEQAREAWEAPFKRSRRGNLWRLWQGKTLCVFSHTDGSYGWSITESSKDGPRFSQERYEDEEEAMDSLWGETGWREWQSVRE
jgi:hypothetical protein